MSRFSSLESVKDMLSSGIVSGLVDGLVSVFTLILMFYYSTSLTVIVIIGVLIYLIFRQLFFSTIKSLTEEFYVYNANQTTNFMESLRALKLIKMFGKETTRTSLWQDKYSAEVTAKVKIDQLNAIFESSKDLLLGGITIIVFYIGAYNVLQDKFSIGMLMAFIAYKESFVNSSIALVEKYIEFRMLELHLSRLSDIVFEEAEEKPTSNYDLSIIGHLSCRNLCFRYAENEPYIFEGINIDIEQGNSVAIIGPSGVGKSTLINLLMGLTKASAGELVIDGKPLQNSMLSQYRRLISSVSQDDTLISGSILDNIIFFDKNPDMNFVAKCAFEASILDEINLMPMQFYTRIGDMGAALSGGQKQRIILARALYRKPKILFLDEATSHLDSGNESQINMAIKALEMTRVVVAHRKETILSCDYIYELKNNLLLDITHDYKKSNEGSTNNGENRYGTK